MQGGSDIHRLFQEPPTYAFPTMCGRCPGQYDYYRALELFRGDFEESTWQAFWRTAVDNQTPAEVAAALGMSKVAVRQAKARVLRRLKEVVGDLIAQPADSSCSTECRLRVRCPRQYNQLRTDGLGVLGRVDLCRQLRSRRTNTGGNCPVAPIGWHVSNALQNTLIVGCDEQRVLEQAGFVVANGEGEIEEGPWQEGEESDKVPGELVRCTGDSRRPPPAFPGR